MGIHSEIYVFFVVKPWPCRIRRNARPGFRKSCSQTRTTRQPFRRRVRVTSRSRSLLRRNLRFQKGRLPRGRVECLGQPCQKQPSTNTAILNFGNTKSGRPKTGRCRRHPEIPCRRKSRTRTSSVSLFPRERMRAITADRFALEKTSDTFYL
jgi:hypothetical protein